MDSNTKSTSSWDRRAASTLRGEPFNLNSSAAETVLQEATSVTIAKKNNLAQSKTIILNSDQLADSAIEEKTQQVLKNLNSVLAGVGLSFKNVVKTSILVALTVFVGSILLPKAGWGLPLEGSLPSDNSNMSFTVTPPEHDGCWWRIGIEDHTNDELGHLQFRVVDPGVAKLGWLMVYNSKDMGRGVGYKLGIKGTLPFFLTRTTASPCA